MKASQRGEKLQLLKVNLAIRVVRSIYVWVGYPSSRKAHMRDLQKSGTQHQEPKIPTRIVIRSAYISTTTPSKGVLILRNHGNLHIPQPHQAGLVLGIATPTRLLLDEL